MSRLGFRQKAVSYDTGIKQTDIKEPVAWDIQTLSPNRETCEMRRAYRPRVEDFERIQTSKRGIQSKSSRGQMRVGGLTEKGRKSDGIKNLNDAHTAC